MVKCLLSMHFTTLHSMNQSMVGTTIIPAWQREWQKTPFKLILGYTASSGPAQTTYETLSEAHTELNITKISLQNLGYL